MDPVGGTFLKTTAYDPSTSYIQFHRILHQNDLISIQCECRADALQYRFCTIADPPSTMHAPVAHYGTQQVESTPAFSILWANALSIALVTSRKTVRLSNPPIEADRCRCLCLRQLVRISSCVRRMRDATSTSSRLLGLRIWLVIKLVRSA